MGGITPSNRLFDKSKYCKFFSAVNDDGIEPRNRLYDKSIDCKALRTPRVLGRTPLKALWDKFRDYYSEKIWWRVVFLDGMVFIPDHLEAKIRIQEQISAHHRIHHLEQYSF